MTVARPFPRYLDLIHIGAMFATLVLYWYTPLATKAGSTVGAGVAGLFIALHIRDVLQEREIANHSAETGQKTRAQVKTEAEPAREAEEADHDEDSDLDEEMDESDEDSSPFAQMTEAEQAAAGKDLMDVYLGRGSAEEIEEKAQRLHKVLGYETAQDAAPQDEEMDEDAVNEALGGCVVRLLLLPAVYVALRLAMRAF